MVQLVAYGERVKRECKSLTECLDASRRTFLGVFASFVVLSEVWITGLHCDHGRMDDGWWRDESRLARVDASGELALCDDGPGTFLGDDLEVVRATSVCDVDGRCGPVSEDDGPLLLSHRDVLGVVVPVVVEGIELSLKLVGDGEDEGVVGGRVKVSGAEKGEGFSFEEILDLAPDERSDGCLLGHCVLVRKEVECL